MATREGVTMTIAATVTSDVMTIMMFSVKEFRLLKTLLQMCRTIVRQFL